MLDKLFYLEQAARAGIIIACLSLKNMLIIKNVRVRFVFRYL